MAALVVRQRWVVLLLWLAAAILATGEVERVGQRLSSGGSPPAGTESAAADRLLRDRFSDASRDVLVLAVESPVSFDSLGAAPEIDSLSATLARSGWIEKVISAKSTGDSALVRSDRRATALFLPLRADNSMTSLEAVQATRDLVSETSVRMGLVQSGWRLSVTGESALDADLRTLSAESSRTSELRVLPLVFVVLVLAFGAVAAAALPIAVGMLAIWTALAVISLLALITPVSVYVLNITSMLGLGVGIDYSLLVLNRFREERPALGKLGAAIAAIETAGKAVITSGLTVIVGFAALLLTPLGETRSLGLGGVIVIAAAVLLSITLLPALLALLGNGLNWPSWLSRVSNRFRGAEAWRRWAWLVMRRRWWALIAGLLVVVMLSWPVWSLKIGLPARHWWPEGTESAQGLHVLDGLGMGAVAQPIRMLVELPEGRRATEAAALRGLQRLGDSLGRDPRVRTVRSVAQPKELRSVLALSMLYADLDDARKEFPDFIDSYLSKDERVAVVDVVLADSVTLVSGLDLVRRVRLVGQESYRGLEGARVTVGGFHATELDLQDRVMSQLPLIAALVLGITALMLAVAFRSVVVPIKAVLLNLLSVAVSFGMVTLVFQQGKGSALLGLDGPTEAIYTLVPLLVFAIVFGLSMDYEVFLLARVREAWIRTGHNETAIAEGVATTAGTITWAALIMILVFGAFAFGRVLVVQIIGFGLAVAVLLDATLIRLLLAPALMRLAGRWNWWPGTTGGRREARDERRA